MEIFLFVRRVIIRCEEIQVFFDSVPWWNRRPLLTELFIMVNVLCGRESNVRFQVFTPFAPR